MKRIFMMAAAVLLLAACQQPVAVPDETPTASPTGGQAEEGAVSTDPPQDTENSYDNPIDAYFQPKMVSDYNVAEATRRGYQDTYRGVWKAEYKHLLKWLKKKCVYEEDRKNIETMDKALKSQIESMREVLATELLGNYKINPDSTKLEGGMSRMSSWGNGTRSRLNQIEGEMYRDTAMRIIEMHGDYKFRKLDYAKESYE